ncbi:MULTISPECIES: hypothetical protein [unclassified Mesorhizobium]|uniref:hypothetical protein n=1 Tax=unclassified Mesorhizobium TaxID=325217 RepID=UPI001CCB7027|nr:MULTISPECIES: hypothetical protein [unclassified Mesorhizobium]MBZ9741293.1 hypothetical protein [Mesorhizobium sp. CO1-1-4]MBZ9804571.1 hypothetical protein [Mesorhizobium sp. ES1-6]
MAYVFFRRDAKPRQTTAKVSATFCAFIFGTCVQNRGWPISSQSSDGRRIEMVRVLAAAMLTLGLLGGAMAQSNGSGNGASGGTNGASGGATNSGNTNAGTTNASGSGDQSGAPDKCKTGANGTTTTTDGTTTKQEAANCPK